MSEDPRLTRLSAICLALPEATREVTGRHATFRIRGKTFAYFLDDHHGDGIVGITCRAPWGEPGALVAGDPERFYLPAYLASRGWIGLRLDVSTIDWDEVADLVTDSYLRVAPKRLGRPGQVTRCYLRLRARRAVRRTSVPGMAAWRSPKTR